MNNKTIYIIIASVLIVSLLAIFVYLITRDANSSNKKTNENATETKTTNKTEPIFQDQITIPTLSLDEKSITYYSAKSAGFNELSLSDNKILNFHEFKVGSIIKAVWSPNKKIVLILIKHKDGAQTIYEFAGYNFENKQAFSLNKNIKDVIWSPNSQQIVYHYLDEDKNLSNLSISNFDGTNWTKIIDIPPTPHSFGGWIDSKDLIYFMNPTDVSGTNLFSLNIDTGKISSLTEPESSKEATVSPTGKNIIYEKFDPTKLTYQLAAMNTEGQNQKNLNIDSGGTIRGTWIDDDRFLMVTYSPSEKSDRFRIINLIDGKTSDLTGQKNNLVADLQSVMVAKNTKIIYFTSNGVLSKLHLP